MDENSPAPFSREVARHDAFKGSKPSSSKGGTTSAPFSYVPPENRTRHTGVDHNAANNQTRVDPENSSNPATILQLSFNRAKANKSKREIDTRVALLAKGEASRADTFSDKLQYHCAKEPKAILDRLQSGPCVWCSETPAYSKDKLPRIFPIKFTQTRGEYVCESCISDLDVQRMVGLG